MNGAWEPFWMGPRQRRMYAAMHPASDGPGIGVVLVPPLLHEMPLSRRFLTQVAMQLASQGFPCLRFDFYGTGDSSGSGEEVDFSSMRHDIATATETLRELVPLRWLCLVAWRGSALPLLGEAASRKNVDLTVLWEPVTHGQQWLDQLLDADARERSARPGMTAAPSDDGNLMGLPVSRQLRDDLARTRVEASASSTGSAIWTLSRDATAPREGQQRAFVLPESAPQFSDCAAMDKMFFLTAEVRTVVNELGNALKDAMQT